MHPFQCLSPIFFIIGLFNLFQPTWGFVRPARTARRTTATWAPTTLTSSMTGNPFHPERMSQLSMIPAVQEEAQEQESSSTSPAFDRQRKTWTDDGFVFGLADSGLERPKGKVAVTVVDGDSLETKPYQQVIVYGTLMGHAVFLASSLQGMLELNYGNLPLTILQAVLLAISSWIVADFGSGVLHWSVDNYGNGKTPIMGGIIAAFQGHHMAPWTITERGFCNNVYKLCIPFGVIPMLIISYLAGPSVTFFATTFCFFEIMSQEFHKWSHQLQSEIPPWVDWLQQRGLTVSRKAHGLHHIAPYEGNYAIISGITNSMLDRIGFYRWLEHRVYEWNGVESNAWKLDPVLKERTLRGDYGHQ